MNNEDTFIRNIFSDIKADLFLVQNEQLSSMKQRKSNELLMI